VLSRQEKEFLRAYRAHMYAVQRELQALKAKADDAAVQLAKNEKIRSLEAERDWYRGEAVRLDGFATQLKSDVSFLRDKLGALEDDRAWFEGKAKAEHRQRRILQARIQGLAPDAAMDHLGGAHGADEDDESGLLPPSLRGGEGGPGQTQHGGEGEDEELDAAEVATALVPAPVVVTAAASPRAGRQTGGAAAGGTPLSPSAVRSPALSKTPASARLGATGAGLAAGARKGAPPASDPMAAVAAGLAGALNVLAGGGGGGGGGKAGLANTSASSPLPTGSGRRAAAALGAGSGAAPSSSASAAAVASLQEEVSALAVALARERARALKLKAKNAELRASKSGAERLFKECIEETKKEVVRRRMRAAGAGGGGEGGGEGFAGALRSSSPGPDGEPTAPPLLNSTATMSMGAIEGELSGEHSLRLAVAAARQASAGEGDFTAHDKRALVARLLQEPVVLGRLEEVLFGGGQ
jgi:hypothetical protein